MVYIYSRFEKTFLGRKKLRAIIPLEIELGGTSIGVYFAIDFERIAGGIYFLQIIVKNTGMAVVKRIIVDKD